MRKKSCFQRSISSSKPPYGRLECSSDNHADIFSSYGQKYLSFSKNDFFSEKMFCFKMFLLTRRMEFGQTSRKVFNKRPFFFRGIWKKAENSFFRKKLVFRQNVHETWIEVSTNTTKILRWKGPKKLAQRSKMIGEKLFFGKKCFFSK